MPMRSAVPTQRIRLKALLAHSHIELWVIRSGRAEAITLRGIFAGIMNLASMPL